MQSLQPQDGLDEQLTCRAAGSWRHMQLHNALTKLLDAQPCRTCKARSADRRRAGLLLRLQMFVAGICLPSCLHPSLSMLASTSTCSLASFRT